MSSRIGDFDFAGSDEGTRSERRTSPTIRNAPPHTYYLLRGKRHHRTTHGGGSLRDRGPIFSQNIGWLK